MSKALSLKRTTTTALKAAGFFNDSDKTIEIDGEKRPVKDLFTVFDGCDIEISIKVKDEEEVDVPKQNGTDEDQAVIHTV